jgi:predicted nucleic acid-binding protein
LTFPPTIFDHITQKKLAKITVILINYAINLKAIELINKYSLSHGLALPDALIAATAIEIDMKLFTYNIRDFRYIDKLDLYK